MVRAFGRTVKPMLMAFERLVSSTLISFLTSPPFYRKERKTIHEFLMSILKKLLKNVPRRKTIRSEYCTKSTRTQSVQQIYDDNRI